MFIEDEKNERLIRVDNARAFKRLTSEGIPRLSIDYLNGEDDEICFDTREERDEVYSKLRDKLVI